MLARRGSVLVFCAALLLPVPAAAQAATPVLPNLVQRVPYQVSATASDPQRPGRQQLIFASAVDNFGPGPLIVDGVRLGFDPGSPMTASQGVLMSDGTRRAGYRPKIGSFYYDGPHDHWHMRGFERYELRSLRNKVVAPSLKAGFCLGDRYKAVTDYVLPNQPTIADPELTTECARGDRTIQTLRTGISVGWGDDYAPQLEGQLIDVTKVRSGTYVLVHRVNVDRSIRERAYSDNVASVRLVLGRRGGKPVVNVLGRCPLALRCDPRKRPVAKAKPVVRQQGRTLTCARGTWTRKPTRFYYQWYRGGYVRPAATSRTYRLGADERGRPFQCRVTAANAFQSTTSRSKLVVSR